MKKMILMCALVVSVVGCHYAEPSHYDADKPCCCKKMKAEGKACERCKQKLAEEE